RAEIWACIARLKAEGMAILVVDKHVEAVSKVADHLLILEKGRVAWNGTPEALRENPGLRERLLGV
ncbi:MAG: ABC transporter ATP-binding protein, partial [Rhodospirillaceae bacterium]